MSAHRPTHEPPRWPDRWPDGEPTHEGPSWLKLEQRLLDELAPAEAAEVDAHGAEGLAALRADLRPLPPLDLSRGDSGLSLPDEHAADAVIPFTRLRRAGLLGVMALAAAALLAVLLPGDDGEQGVHLTPPGPEATWKGGSLSLDLDRSRDGEVTEHATRARPGDRLRVRLTCPPGERSWDLVVYQGGEASFPLTPEGPLRCGNRAALPGAFTLDDPGPATVCVALDPPSRRALAIGPRALPEGSVCVRLDAE